ncbi:MAG TPA: VanZ family protein [Casimicrobiaceae bacterium]|nr:VanZ family protein [Casimicrobiaceae bacterium]
MHTRPSLTLFLITIALVIYGSLYPFAIDPTAATHERVQAMLDVGARMSLSDALGNVALFVPLGFALAALTSGAPRPGTGIVGVAIALILAFVLQVLQLWVPLRTPALADALFNILGFAMGFGAGGIIMVAARACDWQPRFIDWLSVSLIAAWALSTVLPAVPAFDWSALRGHVKALLVERSFNAISIASAATSVTLVAAIVDASIPGVRAFVVTACLVAAIFALEMISPGAYVSLSAPLGYALGLVVWLVLARLRRMHQFTMVLVLALASYSVAALDPFRLRSDAAAFHWVPFAAVLKGSMIINTKALVGYGFQLCALVLVGMRAGARPLGLGICLAIWALVIEVVQTWIEGRTGDVTITLFPLAFGYLIHRWQKAGLFDVSRIADPRNLDPPRPGMPVTAR